MRYLFFLITCFTLSVGCTSLSPEAYVRRVHHSAELSKELETEDGYRLRVIYEPSELLALRSMIAEGIPLEEASFQERLSHYSAMNYFVLELRHREGKGDPIAANLQDAGDYALRLDYLQYGIRSDLKLLVGVDTITCQLYHFERTYGLSPVLRAVFAFPKSNADHEDLQIMLTDRVFGWPTQNFRIARSALSNLPKLSF